MPYRLAIALFAFVACVGCFIASATSAQTGRALMPYMLALVVGLLAAVLLDGRRER